MHDTLDLLQAKLGEAKRCATDSRWKCFTRVMLDRVLGGICSFFFCFHGVLYAGIDLRVRLSIRRLCAGGKCLDFVLTCFTDGKRPIGEERLLRRRKGKHSRLMKCYVMPAFSERVLSRILNFVGVLIDEDGEPTVVGNSSNHIEQCIRVLSLPSSIRCATYGWHPQQLSAAEYVAVVSREVSANLDLMSEARGRPRPSQRGGVTLSLQN